MVVDMRTSEKRVFAQYAVLVVMLVVATQFAPHVSLERLQTFAYEQTAAAIGMGATIAPNEFNSLALELEAKGAELTERERELLAKEEALTRAYHDAIAENNKVTFIVIGTVSAILLLLIFLNFYLDWRRRRTDSTKGAATHSGELQTRL